MTNFQYYFCHFINVHGKNPMSNRLEDDRFLCTIWRGTLGEFCSRRTRTVKNNLMVLKGMNEVVDEFLGMVGGLTDLGPFPLRDEVCMGVACYTLIIYMIIGKYTEHLEDESMVKSPMSWRNIYDTG